MDTIVIWLVSIIVIAFVVVILLSLAAVGHYFAEKKDKSK